jgi:hypothetical protein
VVMHKRSRPKSRLGMTTHVDRNTPAPECTLIALHRAHDSATTTLLSQEETTTIRFYMGTWSISTGLSHRKHQDIQIKLFKLQCNKQPIFRQ